MCMWLKPKMLNFEKKNSLDSIWNFLFAYDVALLVSEIKGQLEPKETNAQNDYRYFFFWIKSDLLCFFHVISPKKVPVVSIILTDLLYLFLIFFVSSDLGERLFVVCCSYFCWCWCNCWSLLFSGKTTLTKTLEKKLEATRFYSPPPKVNHLRKIFVALPEIIQRAYYCVGNFIAAIQIAKECQHKAVIMDRYSIAFYDRKPAQWYTD